MRLKSTLIFCLEKEKPLLSSRELRNRLIKKYGLDEAQANVIVTQIINYQIDKYGTIIDKRAGKTTYSDKQHANHNASLRRYYRKQREENNE